MTWTEQRVDDLRRMWKAGDTADQISEAMGGIGRNAVIGKANRLGLQSRNKHRPDRKPKHPERPIRNRLDRFANLIKDDIPVPIAAERLGLSAKAGNAYMQKLIAAYGG